MDPLNSYCGAPGTDRCMQSVRSQGTGQFTLVINLYSRHQPTLLTHPLNALYQFTLSIHPLNTPY